MDTHDSMYKLRRIVFIMSGLVVAVVIVGGIIHYRSLRTMIVDEAHAVVESRTAKLAEIINHGIQRHQMAVAQLALYPEVVRFLKGPDANMRRQVTGTLSRFADALGGIAYLMDTEGNVLADSPKAIGFSLVGNNYGFRPYFKHAVKGSPFIYLALGKTTQKRGIYYSHPVKDGNTVIGVVVIKLLLDFFDRQLQTVSPYDSIVFLSPDGIIFSSSHREYLLQSFWQLKKENLEKLQESLQMGPGPWQWAGFIHANGPKIQDRQGREYVLHEYQLPILPGWEIAYLHNIKKIIDEKVAPPLRVVAAFIFLALAGAGVAVSLLFREANREIDKRHAAEQEKEQLIGELQKALDEVKTLRGIIPICSFCKKIRDDAGAWNQMESYISKHSDAMFSHGLCPSCLKEHYGMDVDDPE